MLAILKKKKRKYQTSIIFLFFLLILSASRAAASLETTNISTGVQIEQEYTSQRAACCLRDGSRSRDTGKLKKKWMNICLPGI